jgi:hypothetical protein
MSCNASPGYYCSLGSPTMCHRSYYCLGGSASQISCPGAQTSSAGAAAASDCYDAGNSGLFGLFALVLLFIPMWYCWRQHQKKLAANAPQNNQPAGVVYHPVYHPQPGQPPYYTPPGQQPYGQPVQPPIPTAQPMPIPYAIQPTPPQPAQPFLPYTPQQQPLPSQNPYATSQPVQMRWPVWTHGAGGYVQVTQ